MDNFSYLNQISASNSTAQPAKKPTNFLFANKKLRIFFIVAGALIVLCIAFGIISSILNRETDYLPRLKLRATNISQIIRDYNPKVKSSSLRAAGSSLSSVIDDTINNTSSYISSEYKTPESITSEETAIKSSITSALDEAKINGYLDRTYARQLTYAVNILLSLETEASAHTNDKNVQTYLANSAESLNNILPAFSDFSDTAK